MYEGSGDPKQGRCHRDMSIFLAHPSSRECSNSPAVHAHLRRHVEVIMEWRAKNSPSLAAQKGAETAPRSVTLLRILW
jgi:hypothetical protein